MTGLAERVVTVARDLPAAQARVARLITDDPSTIAFGTVASVAEAADTSPQTVLRLAVRLGADGFGDLQAEVRDEMVARLPPAAARIRRPASPDPRAAVLAADLGNVECTLDVADADLESVVKRMAEADHVGVVVAEAWAGVGSLFAGWLGQLRDGVVVIDGPRPRVVRRVAALTSADVLVAVDVRRYERWVLDAVRQAAANDVAIVALSDGPMAPIGAHAAVNLVIGVDSPGPFESATGVVSLLHALIVELAVELRATAQPRLDAVEAAWRDQAALLPDPADPPRRPVSD